MRNYWDLKILFIDEANLDICQWSQFEELFQQPRTILLNGELTTISDKHKVLFAGNPVSYGDDRSLASLFERHGNAVLFKPLPLNNIYEDILKPIFTGGPETVDENDILKLCQPILAVYQFLCEKSQDEILITPRELQMMALLLRYGKQKNSSLERAQHFAREIARQAVPEPLKAAFDETFPSTTIQSLPNAEENDAFLITSSRQALIDLLEENLTLREQRQKGWEQMNEAQRYGGLGGIIVESPPGIGKSEILIKYLLKHGYKPADLNNTEILYAEKCYYKIPVSMGYDLNGNRPQNPGFMIFATQNPISIDGRMVQSTALSRRSIKLTLADYPSDELTAIISHTHPQLTMDTIGQMIAAYQQEVAYAKQHGLKHQPCTRDLFHLAKKIAENLAGNEISPDIKAPKNENDNFAWHDKKNTTDFKFFSLSLQNFDSTTKNADNAKKQSDFPFQSKK